MGSTKENVHGIGEANLIKDISMCILNKRAIVP